MKSKKLISIIGLVFSMMLFVGSCGTNSNNTTNNNGNIVTEFGTLNLKEGTGQYDKKTMYLNGSTPEAIPAAAKNRKDTLVLGIFAPNGVFNPLLEESGYDADVNDAIWTPLLDVGYDGMIIDGIANMPEVSEDGKKYTFTLKEGVKWQDGTLSLIHI